MIPQNTLLGFQLPTHAKCVAKGGKNRSTKSPNSTESSGQISQFSNQKAAPCGSFVSPTYQKLSLTKIRPSLSIITITDTYSYLLLSFQKSISVSFHGPGCWPQRRKPRWRRWCQRQRRWQRHLEPDGSNDTPGAPGLPEMVNIQKTMENHHFQWENSL